MVGKKGGWLATSKVGKLASLPCSSRSRGHSWPSRYVSSLETYPLRRSMEGPFDHARSRTSACPRDVPALEKEVGGAPSGTDLYDLRAFGEAFRAYGRAEASDEVYPTVRARQGLLESVVKARALGEQKDARRASVPRATLLVGSWTGGRKSDSLPTRLTGLGGSFSRSPRETAGSTGRPS